MKDIPSYVMESTSMLSNLMLKLNLLVLIFRTKYKLAMKQLLANYGGKLNVL